MVSRSLGMAPKAARSTSSRKTARGGGAAPQQAVPKRQATATGIGVWQPKLRVGPAQDVYEREADAAADAVMRSEGKPTARLEPRLQRTCTCQGGKDANCPACSPLVGQLQRRSVASGDAEAPAAVDTALASAGTALGATTRQFFESRFGHDFAGVRVHTDAQANASAQSVNALAYTVGRHVVFSSGAYQPSSSTGRRLLAHELAHVVQQGAAVPLGAGQTRRGAAPATAQVLQRDAAAPGTRTSTISVRYTDDDVEFYHRVIRAIDRSPGFRGVSTASLWQPFHDPAFAIYARLSRALTAEGSSVTLRASAFFDPTVFHGQLTNGRLQLEQEARLAETTVTAVITPRDNFAGRSLTRLGVAEVADLSFTATPSVAAAHLGGLQWIIASGAGVLSAATNTGTATYTAPSAVGSVRLELRVVTGLAAGRVVATLGLGIVAPNDALMQQLGSGVCHVNGFGSVGFHGEIFLRPTTVSFQNIQFSEGDGRGIGIGYFVGIDGAMHCATNACNNPSTVGVGNSASGSKVNGVDTVNTNSLSPPFSAGVFMWPIQWQFRVGTAAWAPFTVAVQTQTIDASGTTTISKKGAGPFMKRVVDPTTTC